MSPLPSIEAQYKANAATEGFLGALNRCDHRKFRIVPGNPVRGHSRLAFPHSLGHLRSLISFRFLDDNRTHLPHHGMRIRLLAVGRLPSLKYST